MFAPYRFQRCASTKNLCRLCLRAGVFLGHHSRGVSLCFWIGGAVTDASVGRFVGVFVCQCSRLATGLI